MKKKSKSISKKKSHASKPKKHAKKKPGHSAKKRQRRSTVIPAHLERAVFNRIVREVDYFVAGLSAAALRYRKQRASWVKAKNKYQRKLAAKKK